MQTANVMQLTRDKNGVSTYQLTPTRVYEWFFMYDRIFFVHRFVSEAERSGVWRRKIKDYRVSEYLTGRIVVERQNNVKAAITAARKTLRIVGKKRLHEAVKSYPAINEDY